MLNMFLLLFITAFFKLFCQGIHTKTIEELELDYEDEKNFMIAVTQSEDTVYDDFYDEINSKAILENSIDMVYFGPPNSFLRLDSESILHILSYTRKNLVPISRTLLAWDVITDGKTAAFLQGREFRAFGSLLNVVPEEDLYYVNFGDPSVFNYFAKTDIRLSKRKYGVLAASYRRYFGNTWYTNGSQINELGHLLCAFPPSDFRRITPATFKEVTSDVLNKLDRCNVEQTKTLYNIATHPDAYGEPYKWSSHEIGRLDTLFICIPKGQISSIKLEAIPAISPTVMRLISQKKLEYFTRPQILRMNVQTRRIYILRIQLKHSLDTKQITKKNAWILNVNYIISVITVVTLLFFNY